MIFAMNLDGRISRVVDHRRNREIVWVDSQRCRGLTDDGFRLARNNNQRTAQYAKVHAGYCKVAQRLEEGNNTDVFEYRALVL